MLKTDLHLHASEDKGEEYTLKYSAKNIIDKAAKLNFDVLAFTFHNNIFYPRKLINYAKQKGILLIQGIEKTIEGKHVLLYNIGKKELSKIKTLQDLKNLKENVLVIAAHPFSIHKTSLKKKLKKNISSFDALEYCPLCNIVSKWNQKTLDLAKKHKKSVIVNSDSHRIKDFGSNFSLINSEKNVDSVIRAIKKGRIEHGIQKTTFWYFFLFCLSFLFNSKKKVLNM